jgi:hypothetical protein
LQPARAKASSREGRRYLLILFMARWDAGCRAGISVGRGGTAPFSFFDFGVPV